MMGFSRLKAAMTTNCDTMTNFYVALMFAILMINLPVSSANPVSSSTNFHTARNIRHLPCIVRKSGLSGVCMFAIDCIKQNGTHLGTCIDRFYFGSCCQLKEEPFHAQEILDNSIDQNTISHFSHESTTHHPTSALFKLTTELNAIKNISRNDSPLEHKEDAMELTTVPNTTTVKISTTTPSLLTTNKIKESSVKTSTVEPQKFSTFQTVDTTTPYEKPASPTTAKPLVNRKTTTTTTTTTTTQRPKITRKPITTSSSSQASSSSTQSAKTTVKPKPQITKRPATTRKPISQSTKRPPSVNNHYSNNSTTLNGRPKPTRRPIISTTSTATKLSAGNNATTLSESTVTTTTTSPVTVATTAKAPRPRPKPTAEIVKVPRPSTTEKAILTTKSTTLATTTTTSTTTTKTTTTTTTTTPRPVLSTTHKPSLVTWTEVSDDKVNKTEITNNDATPPSDWVPVPTIRPDNDANKTVVPSSSESTLDLMTTQGTPQPTENDGHHKNSTDIEDTPVITTISDTTESVPSKTESMTSSTTKRPTTTGLPIVSSESIEAISESEEEGQTITETHLSFNETIQEVSSTTPSSFEGVDYKKICGRRMFPQPRIVGGSNAAFGRWPWQISLRQWRTSTYLHKCGAALLNENWAITAAHCVDNVPPSDLLLRLGEYDLAEEEEPYGYQERKVQIVASHPQFDQRTFEYDLALLRFYEPVVFQPNIVPVCVPESDKSYIGQTAYVTGWGRLYEDGPLPSVLQEVAVPVINNTICEAMYYEAGYKESIPHIFICAGWRKGGYDSCEGDSGGPMVLQREEDKRFILGGVISWGIGCAEPNQPGVYTRISEFRDWINQILQF